MSRQEEFTHKQLIELLVNDENVFDNINVSDLYEPDQYGNTVITMSIPGVTKGRKKGIDGLVVFNFNKLGRLIGVEIATHKKSDRNWQIASASQFVDFTPRYGDERMSAILDSHKKGQ